jgi:hypothetical protein
MTVKATRAKKTAKKTASKKPQTKAIPAKLKTQVSQWVNQADQNKDGNVQMKELYDAFGYGDYTAGGATLASLQDRYKAGISTALGELDPTNPNHFEKSATKSTLLAATLQNIRKLLK